MDNSWAPQSFYSNLRPPAEILRESEAFFMREGAVHQTLGRLARNLDAEEIPYVVVGAMALNLLGYTRETTDVDILLTRSGLQRLHDRLVGRGYVPAFQGAEKSFRDTETNTKIEVLISGEYPGDGKPKPVVFPNPADVAIDRGGVRVIALERLIELKLASGLTAPHRLRDLADVQDLIVLLGLPLGLAEQLDPSVQPEYHRLWELAQHAREGPHERE